MRHFTPRGFSHFCRNCGAVIRPVEPRDGVDPVDYAWVHDDGGNPVCDWTPVAEPHEP